MEIRYNFDKCYKLYMACADEELRPVLGMVHFRNGFAYASDAHILVRVPIDVCWKHIDPEDKLKLEGASIPAKLLKKIYSYNRLRLERDDEKGELRIITKIDYDVDVVFRILIGAYKIPNFEAVINQIDEERSVQTIKLNISLLNRLSQALNVNVLKMKFSDDIHKIRLENLEMGCVGIVMPARE